MSSRNMPQRYLHCRPTGRKWNPVNKDNLQKKAKLDEVLAAHCRAELVTECMKKKKKTLNIIRWLSFSFFGRKWMSIFVSFSAVNGISFSSAFSFTAEKENSFSVGLQYTSQMVLVLRCKVLVLVLNTRLGLGLERILKSWSRTWSWN